MCVALRSYNHEEVKVFRKTLEDKDKHITDEQGEDSSDSVHDSIQKWKLDITKSKTL